jgi:hypothetical protein
MKVLWLLFRAGGSLFVAFIASFPSAVIFFKYSEYETTLDRFFLVAVPTLAIAYLLFVSFPTLLSWLQQRQLKVLIAFGLLAVIGAVAVVLPVAISRVYYLGMAAFGIVLFLLMAPTIPVVERMRVDHSMWHYVFGFLLSFIFAYGAVGFLGGVLKTVFSMLVFTGLLILVGSLIGYYLVRRAARSFRDGFLSRPLNVFLCLTLPVLLAGLLYASVQFPSMFIWIYITVPREWFGLFLASAIVTGTWGVSLLEQFESRGFYERFRQTRLFAFIKENLPGLYAGGMFFLINLILARALNHTAFSINSVVFEADAGPWMSILGLPEGEDVNRSVHPMVLITLRPLVRLVGIFMAEKWYLAPMIVIAAMSGLCVLMAWIFVKRATEMRTYAFIFAIFLGSTAAHLLFGSLTETYVFGMTSLIFFFLLVQAGEKRFSVLVPTGLLVFGITITNIAQGVIGLFFNKFGFWRLVRYCMLIITGGIALTALTSVLYPGKQTFFFVPADLAFEARFSKPVYEAPADRLLNKFQLVTRTMFFYGITAPKPIEDIARKDTNPTIDLKTYKGFKDRQEPSYASYDGLANIPLTVWLILLAGSFVFFLKGLRSSPHMPLMLGLLGSLGFNFFLHMNYGTELFLYTPYWVYALVFFIALAYAELANQKWFEAFLITFLLLLMINNAWFIFVVLRGLAPYFAAVPG